MWVNHNNSNFIGNSDTPPPLFFLFTHVHQHVCKTSKEHLVTSCRSFVSNIIIYMDLDDL